MATTARTKQQIKDINQGQSKLAKAVGAQRKGVLVYWWLTGIMALIQDVKAYYSKHSLDWDKWGPPEQKSTVAFRKTLKEVGRDINQKGDDKGYLIRLIDDTDTYLLYGIVKEDRLKSQETLAHDCEAIVKLIKDTGMVKTSKDNGTAGYAIAEKVKDLFDTMMVNMIVQDFSRLLTRNIHMMASVSIRPTGAVYFVPEAYRDVLCKMRSVLDEVSGDSHISMIDIWGEQDDLARDTRKALHEELVEIKQEMEDFKSKAPREDTLKNRLATFKQLKERARMFAEVLDFNAKDLLKGLDQCGAAVKAMLDGGHFKGADNKAKKAAKQEEPTKVIRNPVEESKPKAKKAAKKKTRKVAPKAETKRVSTLVADRQKAASKAQSKGKKKAASKKRKAS